MKKIYNLFLIDNQGQRHRVFFLIRKADSLKDAILQCEAFSFESNIPTSPIDEATTKNEYKELLKR